MGHDLEREGFISGGGSTHFQTENLVVVLKLRFNFGLYQKLIFQTDISVGGEQNGYLKVQKI